MLYVFRERKLPLLARWRAGEEPDTLLFGFNHLAEHHIAAGVYEPDYGPAGRALARQVGRLGPDLLQLRALPQFRRYDAVLLTAGWPLLLLARRLLRRPPRLVWLNLSVSTLAGAAGRSASPLARVRARLLRHALSRADCVLCVARAQQQWLRTAAGLGPERLPFIPSGVDASFHTPLAVPRDDGYVLAVGRDAGRDYATLAEAVRSLARPVHIVASPRNLNGIALPPNVTVHYNLPPARLRELYRGASCVVVPTHGDGYPHGSDCSGTLVLLDAMATAKPVVITERRAVHDYVSPGREALTAPARDPQALRAAIERVLGHGAGAAAMGAAGRAAVERRFNTRVYARDVARLLRDEVASRK